MRLDDADSDVRFPFRRVGVCSATGLAYMAELLHIPHDRLLAVAELHKRLFDEGGQPYYSALLKLSRADGARLEASRYLMFMPATRKNGAITKKCGEGLLAMAASAVRCLCLHPPLPLLGLIDSRGFFGRNRG